MALTSFVPRRGTRLDGGVFDPDDPKKRRGAKNGNGRKGFRPKVAPSREAEQLGPIAQGDGFYMDRSGVLRANPTFREEQPDAARFPSTRRRAGGGPNLLSRVLSNFRMTVDPTQEGFADRGVPGLVTGLIRDIQRNPIPWAPYIGDAIGFQEGGELAGEGQREGSLLKELGGAGIQGLSLFGMGELGRPLARALSRAAEHPELIGAVAAGLRRKPLQGAAPDPTQELLELGDPRKSRNIPVEEHGLMETGDMPGRWFSRTAREIEGAPDEQSAQEWLRLLTGEEGTQFTLAERGFVTESGLEGPLPHGTRSGTATTNVRKKKQVDVPQREVTQTRLGDVLRGGDPQRPVTKQELLQRIDDRMPPMTETISTDAASEYVIPGGENYRAISIGLDVEKMQEELIPRLHRQLAAGDEIRTGSGMLRLDGDEIVLTTGAGPGRVVPNTEEGIAELARSLPEGGLLPPGSSGSHIGGSEEMMHLRVQDNYSFDDIKTLDVIELQSDLFQKQARREGTDLPFSHSDDFTALLVRRSFREAMSGDYRRISFPTGEQIMAIPGMGADQRIADYYDKVVERQVRRVTKELGLPEPEIKHIYEGGMSEEARDEALSEAIDEIVGEWDPTDAEEVMRTNYQDMVREDIDEVFDVAEYLDEDDFLNNEGQLDEVLWEEAVTDAQESYIASAGEHLDYNVPAEWEVREAAMNYENFDRWLENNFEDFAAHGDRSQLETIFDQVQSAFEDPHSFIDDFGTGESFGSLAIDLPEPRKPFEQIDMEISAAREKALTGGGEFDRRADPTASRLPGDPERPARREGGDQRAGGVRRGSGPSSDPMAEEIWSGAERRATNDLDRRAVERAREMSKEENLDPLILLRRALEEQESGRKLSKYEQARKVGMRLSALVGATAVGSQAMQRRREGTR